MDNYQQCYNIRQSALGEDHPDTIKAKDKITEIQAKIAELK